MTFSANVIQPSAEQLSLQSVVMPCGNLFFVLLKVIMLSVIMLNVVMLSAVMLNVIMLSVVMLDVVALTCGHGSFLLIHFAINYRF